MAVICMETDFSVTNPPVPQGLMIGTKRQEKSGEKGTVARTEGN